MPSNVEIKAHISDMESLKKTAAELSGSSGTLILQEDTFFVTPKGRLKLRVLKVCVLGVRSYKVLPVKIIRLQGN